MAVLVSGKYATLKGSTVGDYSLNVDIKRSVLHENTPLTRIFPDAIFSATLSSLSLRRFSTSPRAALFPTGLRLSSHSRTCGMKSSTFPLGSNLSPNSTKRARKPLIPEVNCCCTRNCIVFPSIRGKQLCE